MKVLIAGAGNIGRHLGIDLARRGHGVTLVDVSQRALQPPAQEDQEQEQAQMRKLVGDACSPMVLERAGLREADVAVAATGDDEDNLVISVLAKQEFAVPRVLARVNHPVNEWLFDESWGVDVAVSPPHLLTALVEEEVTAGDVVALLDLEHGRVQLLEVRLDAESAAVGQRIGDLELPADVAIVATVRGGHVIPALASTPLAEGDEVLALVARGRQSQVRTLLVGSR